MQLSVYEFDLIEFTREIVESFKVSAEKKNIDLQFLASTEEIKMWLDMDKMDKILYNLISNSIKYTPKNRSIIVSIFEKEETVELSVKDKGVGISEEDLKNIFTRFYRGKGRNVEGHGIGLSLVKSLVEIQKGSKMVSSKTDQGSEFTLTLKKGKEHFAPNDFETTIPDKLKIYSEESLIEDWKPFSPGIELLLVEDNDDLCNYLKNLLSQHYNIITASNGKEALELLQNAGPELIISDIMMPVMYSTPHLLDH
jgi:anti-sigma regulatory factor (Ser/Thr protein kinase)